MTMRRAVKMWPSCPSAKNQRFTPLRETGMARHFVQIEIGKTAYRFFGLGEWQIREVGKWKSINAIYVPGEALRIAASQCNPEPPPILTEIDIARLCGGRFR
jgi:hypothetical protein